MDNNKLIERFYQSFQELDAAGMAECYHFDVCFSDPVFRELRGQAAIAMWKMLCAQVQSFNLVYSDIEANEMTGSACWEARYIFSRTEREVHNVIESQFQFKDGKIIHHRDHFSFWKWSSMALGPAGLLLGWSPMLRNQVQQQASRNLQHFMKNHL
ncbi:MAG: nuclear transport factor 2 family protein [Gammaproteobacteria bacterium]|nr:nuclear transport factor 2 family protein [Gammaproteobacteria bacterium]